MTPNKPNNRSNQCNKAKSHISRHYQKIYLIFALLFYNNIEKSAPHLKKKWKFAKVTIHLNLENIDEVQKNCFWKIWSDSQIDAIKNQEILTLLKNFISILISLLFSDEITSRELFSCEYKDPRLRWMTLSFKCYNCYFKGCYSSKAVCCCGTTLQRKGIW